MNSPNKALPQIVDHAINWLLLVKKIALLLPLITVAGCSHNALSLNNGDLTRSSLMAFIEADDHRRFQSNTLPPVTSMLSIGIAFVPEKQPDNDSQFSNSLWSSQFKARPISSELKQRTKEQVKKIFEKQDFAVSVETIPDNYIRPSGGFENLKQIQSIMALDVIALVSYDQKQFVNNVEKVYFQIITGPYEFSGEKNDTSTLITTTLLAPDHQKVLVHAQGNSLIKARQPSFNLLDELNQDSVTGFKHAANMMFRNLNLILDRFALQLKK